MNVRRITIPEPQTIRQLDGSPVKLASGEIDVRSFDSFVRERTCDPAFAKTTEMFSMEDILSAVRVSEAVKEAVAKNEPTCDLELEDAERLVRATQSPKNGYNPVVARSVAAFMLAIVNAPIVDNSK